MPQISYLLPVVSDAKDHLRKFSNVTDAARGLPDMGANAPAGAPGNLDFLRIPRTSSHGASESTNLAAYASRAWKAKSSLGEKNVLDDLTAAMPQVVTVTLEERKAIVRKPEDFSTKKERTIRKQAIDFFNKVNLLMARLLSTSSTCPTMTVGAKLVSAMQRAETVLKLERNSLECLLQYYCEYAANKECQNAAGNLILNSQWIASNVN
ncbi:hypothetical protein Tco_0256049 [Tanacetum coccineum]